MSDIIRFESRTEDQFAAREAIKTIYSALQMAPPRMAFCPSPKSMRVASQMLRQVQAGTAYKMVQALYVSPNHTGGTRDQIHRMACYRALSNPGHVIPVVDLSDTDQDPDQAWRICFYHFFWNLEIILIQKSSHPQLSLARKESKTVVLYLFQFLIIFYARLFDFYLNFENCFTFHIPYQTKDYI